MTTETEGCFAHFGGMTWPRPGHRIDEVQWKMRYASETLTRSDLLIAASVLTAYGDLIQKDEHARESVIHGILDKTQDG